MPRRGPALPNTRRLPFPAIVFWRFGSGCLGPDGRPTKGGQGWVTGLFDGNVFSIARCGNHASTRQRGGRAGGIDRLRGALASTQEFSPADPLCHTYITQDTGCEVGEVGRVACADAICMIAWKHPSGGEPVADTVALRAQCTPAGAQTPAGSVLFRPAGREALCRMRRPSSQRRAQREMKRLRDRTKKSNLPSASSCSL